MSKKIVNARRPIMQKTKQYENTKTSQKKKKKKVWMKINEERSSRL